MLRIGPSGNSLSFYEQGHKRTKEAAAWLAGMGLNAYEYSFGRGVRISEEAAAEIAAAFAECDVEISSHAPYYTNFANPDPDMIEKSVVSAPCFTPRRAENRREKTPSPVQSTILRR